MEKIHCEYCNRKIGINGFDCKCGSYFCIKHKFFKDHDCSFNYKTHQREMLKESIIKIKKEKVIKI